MSRDAFGTWDRTAGKQIAYLPSECRREILVLFGAPFLFAETSPFSRFLVGQTLRLSEHQCLILDEDALTLVTTSRATESDHDC